MQASGITQMFSINGVAAGQADTVKMRWRASYNLGGEPRHEQGEVPALGIA